MNVQARRWAWGVAPLAALLVGASFVTTYGQAGAGQNWEWKTYGADLRSTRYAPLDQINASNFGKLEVAWRFKTDSLGPRPEFQLQATPLVIDGIMYSTVSAPQNFTNQVSLPLVATPEWWTATGNTINGAALESTSTGHGYWLYYVDNNRDSAGNDHFGQISGGSVSNVAYGIMLKNKDTDPATNFGNSAIGAHAAVSGTAFSLNAGGTGFRLIDDRALKALEDLDLVDLGVDQRRIRAVHDGNLLAGFDGAARDAADTDAADVA